TFTFWNLGTGPNESCLISDFIVDPGVNAAFDSPDVPLQGIEVLPQGSRDIRVRVRPTGAPTIPISITGSAQLTVSSTFHPTVTVPLTAQMAPACLAVLPEHLDFGTSVVGCKTTRSVSVYNQCATPIALNGIALSNSAPGSPIRFRELPIIPPGGLVLNAG